MKTLESLKAREKNEDWSLYFKTSSFLLHSVSTEIRTHRLLTMCQHASETTDIHIILTHIFLLSSITVLGCSNHAARSISRLPVQSFKANPHLTMSLTQPYWHLIHDPHSIYSICHPRQHTFTPYYLAHQTDLQIINSRQPNSRQSAPAN